MGNIVVGAVLAIIIALAAVSGVKHFRGEGGCCGGGCGARSERKKLSAPKIGEKRIFIEGMQCEHCRCSVEKELNLIEGAAARVSLKKGLAVVEMSRGVSDGELIAAVERAGFKAVRVE